jgi:hypothetical protein
VEGFVDAWINVAHDIPTLQMICDSVREEGDGTKTVAGARFD